MNVDERMLTEKDDKRKIRNETVNSKHAQPADNYSFFLHRDFKNLDFNF